MSKVALAVIGGTAVAAVGTGGIVLSKGGSSLWESDSGSSVEPKLEFKTLTEFKNQKGGQCVDKSFGEVDFSGAATESSDMTKDDFSSLKTGDSQKGCLIVHWKKNKYTNNDNKWNGDFRWLWSFRSGDSGFVMFVTTKGQALDLEGAFYILEKKDDKWTIKKQQEVDSGAKVTVTKPADNLPTVGGGLPKPLSNKEINWTLITNGDTADNFCHSSCDTNNSSWTSKSYSWWFGSSNWASSGSALTSWTNNLDTWYANAFKKGTLNLTEALKDIKGTWGGVRSST